jgi:hypothetical protein
MAVRNTKADVEGLRERAPASTHLACIKTYAQAIKEMGLQY